MGLLATMVGLGTLLLINFRILASYSVYLEHRNRRSLCSQLIAKNYCYAIRYWPTRLSSQLVFAGIQLPYKNVIDTQTAVCLHSYVDMQLSQQTKCESLCSKWFCYYNGFYLYRRLISTTTVLQRPCIHAPVHNQLQLPGPALRIGKLGNRLGPQSQRGPKILTAKTQFCCHWVLSYEDPLCNYILLFISYGNSYLLLNEHSFIIFFTKY